MYGTPNKKKTSTKCSEAAPTAGISDTDSEGECIEVRLGPLHSESAVMAVILFIKTSMAVKHSYLDNAGEGATLKGARENSEEYMDSSRGQ